MTSQEQEELKRLCENARYSPEVAELTEFVSKHKGEHIGGPDAERAVDSFALLTAWIYDMLNGKSYTDPRSKTHKMKKALGYFV